MGEVIALEVLERSPTVFIICLILWIIQFLIRKGKLRGTISFGDEPNKKKNQP